MENIVGATGLIVVFPDKVRPLVESITESLMTFDALA